MDERILETERRLTEVEQRSKSNTHRIDRVEAVTEDIHKMSETMVKLIEVTNHTNENVTEMKKDITNISTRVDEIEKSPGQEHKQNKRIFINAVITAIGAGTAIAIIMLLSKIML